jgi:SAM-dependent methyltransferase
MTGRAVDQLTVLPVGLLRTDADRAGELRELSAELHVPLGWHYLLDLIWASRQLEPVVPGSTLLDAGAGLGLMQWWLARRGARVVSVDRGRRDPSRRLRAAAAVGAVRPGDIAPLRPGIGRLLGVVRSPLPLAARALAAAGVIRDAALGEPDPAAPGTVLFHRASLDDLSLLPDGSVETVVSISSLEHNPPERLEPILKELMRVLRPGGELVATVAGAAAEDWYHRPSDGWCYTEATLRRLFRLDESTPSNFEQWNVLFDELRSSAELREGLADFYFHSEENGMPGGRWDPQYQPVGVVKVKR